MKTISGALAFLLAGSLGLACGGTGLKAEGQGGQSGSGALGGAVGSGGAGAGGTGGTLGGGGSLNAGGNAAGGVIGGGGRVSSSGGAKAGGSGGTNAGGGSVSFGGRGGTGAGGTGGTSCPPMGVCPAIACLYGEMPNPDPCGCPICAPPEAGACPPSCPAAKCAPGSSPGTDSCGCPICIPPDAGAGNDATPDACLALPCLPVACGPGYELVEVLCGCPTCMPVDGGRPDGIIVCPRTCPAVKCAPGSVPSTDVCGCPTCAPVPDAGPDSGQPACVGLDECTCAATAGCSVLAGACYCPFPQCGPGACFCGGGLYIGCAPVELASCDSARARVAALCPEIKGATFDSLCTQSDANCITECLNEVTSCSDAFCTFCEGCDCATDRFSTCVERCKTAGAQ